MKTVKALTVPIRSKGLEFQCFIDAQDFDLISQYHWTLHKEGYSIARVPGTKRQILMHRLIMGVVDKPCFEIDHINHNRLDNRRSNLRFCTRSQNIANSLKIKPGTSQYKGVYLDQNRFHAQIGINNKRFNLGRFFSELDAALCYDIRARQVFGDYACLNLPEVNIKQLEIQF
jgi:hypothetical protein